MVSNIFYFHLYLGKIPILTNIFQMGWNHQLDYRCTSFLFDPAISGLPDPQQLTATEVLLVYDMSNMKPGPCEAWMKRMMRKQTSLIGQQKQGKPPQNNGRKQDLYNLVEKMMNLWQLQICRWFSRFSERCFFFFLQFIQWKLSKVQEKGGSTGPIGSIFVCTSQRNVGATRSMLGKHVR